MVNEGVRFKPVSRNAKLLWRFALLVERPLMAIVLLFTAVF